VTVEFKIGHAIVIMRKQIETKWYMGATAATELNTVSWCCSITTS